MQHIAASGIIHRDLAARNVLLTEHWGAKISDFGLSRTKKQEMDGHVSKADVGPIRWMAPEAMNSKFTSEKSDVWSFGVLVYEVLTRRYPYPDSNNVEVVM